MELTTRPVAVSQKTFLFSLFNLIKIKKIFFQEVETEHCHQVADVAPAPDDLATICFAKLSAFGDTATTRPKAARTRLEKYPNQTNWQ